LNIAILGAGAWGTALAIAFSAQHRVRLWSHDSGLSAALRQDGENRRYLPGHHLPESLSLASDLATALAQTDLLVVATPISGLRPTLQRLPPRDDIPVLWVCKGFERDTGLLPHQVAGECLTRRAGGVLAGPSFAEEVAAGKPTALSLAMLESEAALVTRLSYELHAPNLRIYANPDIVGVEAGGALKNVIAIAAGVCDGLRLGNNARAALITRGLAEIARLGVLLGAQRGTFMGLSGIGDLLLTCAGDLSRNRQIGLALAAGRELPDILATLGHVAEGVSTAHEAVKLASSIGVEMPITQAVSSILGGKIAPSEALSDLLARDPKEESG